MSASLQPALELEAAGRNSAEVDLPDAWYRLSTDRYHSPAYAAAERNAVWEREWQMACRSDEIARPGDWLEYVVGDQSFIVSRDGAGQVHALRNACRHRGNRLCQGLGHARRLTCQFHLWQYELDGTLARVPDRETFPPFDDAEMGLLKGRAAEWAGFVFINPDPAAESFESFIAPLAAAIEAYGVADWIPVGLNITMRAECNWKVGMDAFSESYHVQGIHPQNLPMVNDYDQRYVFFDKHLMFMVPFFEPAPRLGKAGPELVVKGSGVLAKVFGGPDAPNPAEALVAPYRGADGTIALPDGVDMRVLAREAQRVAGASPQLTEAQLTDNYNFLIFPNLSINLRPGEMTLFRFRPDPGGDPQRCIWDAQAYSHVPDPEERRRRREPLREVAPEDPLNLVLAQDRTQLPRQQQGLRTAGLTHLQLSRQEAALAHFHHTLDRLISELPS